MEMKTGKDYRKGENMEEAKKTSGRGGRREGSGRKPLGKKAVTLKLSEESVAVLARQEKKSEFVDELIKNHG